MKPLNKNGIPIISFGKVKRRPCRTHLSTRLPDANSFTKGIAKTIYLLDGGECVYCGTQDALNLDHITPKSKGGQKTRENLVLACVKCNLLKADGPPPVMQYGRFGPKGWSKLESEERTEGVTKR